MTFDPMFIVVTVLILLLSIGIALLPHPEQVDDGAIRILLAILGRLSFLRHKDSPGTLHLPLTSQPPPEDPQPGAITHPTLRMPPPSMGPRVGLVLPMLGLLTASGPSIVVQTLGPPLVFSGCARTLDKARQDFTAALKVATAAQTRLKAGDLKMQMDLVKANDGNPEAATKALLAYRVRRGAVLEEAARCERVMDDAADQLLLSDKPAAEKAALLARAAAMALKAQVDQLLEVRP